MVLCVYQAVGWHGRAAAARVDPQRFYVDALGGYLGTDWRGYVDYATQHRNVKVTEEYWGIFSALDRKLSSWPVDATIHALGRLRGVARTSLDQPDLIVSTRPGFSPNWQSWGLSQNFWFYGPLLADWEVDFVSPNTVVWKKRRSPNPIGAAGCEIGPNGSSFVIGPGAVGLYRVDLKYRVHGAGRFITMVRNTISIAADAHGFVSLDPKATVIDLPVFVRTAGESTFDTISYGGDGVSVTFDGCRAEQMVEPSNEVFLGEALWR